MSLPKVGMITFGDRSKTAREQPISMLDHYWPELLTTGYPPLKLIMSWPALSCLRHWFSSVKKPAS